MIEVTILFFATLRDLTNETKVLKAIPDTFTIKELKDLLVIEYPRLDVIIGMVIVALNHEYAFNQDRIPEGAEIALFPPVSGG
jgi:molybdopterin converting factor subunit 1